MSYEDVDRVIKSGVEDATLFSVLAALAFFRNDGSGLCFPSTETIAKAARRSPNIVRTAIKRLVELGYVSMEQRPGEVRYFTIHFDRLPVREIPLIQKKEKKPLSEVKPLTDVEPLSEVKPLANPKPLSEVKGDPFQNCKGRGFRSERGPLSEVKAEQVNKQVSEQVKGTSNFSTRTSSTSAEKQNASLPDDVPAWVIDQQSSDSYSEATSTAGGSSVSDCGSAVSSREDTLSLTPNEPPAPKKGAKRSNLAARPDDVSEEVWKDYQTLRKAKRAPVTDTVINGLRREAGAAGITLEQAMTFCIERGYQGFKADWYKNAANVGGRPQRDTTRFAHEWRQEDRVYVTDEKMEEMRKTLAMFKEKKSA